MNTDKIVGLCIATAAYSRGWCSDSAFEEMREDFEGIAAYATYNFAGLGLGDKTITEADVAECLFGMDADQLEAAHAN